MASIKDLKKRIHSVKNTQQTTRAMKLVSAAKLRRAQELILNHRPYALKLSELICFILNNQPQLSATFPVCHYPPSTAAPRKKLLVVVTSDRGLCGGFNAVLLKTAVQWLNEQKNLGFGMDINCIGRKGYEYFKSQTQIPVTYLNEMNGKIQLNLVKKLSNQWMDRFLANEFYEVMIVYNHFKNAVSQQVIVERLFPISVQNSDGSFEKWHELQSNLVESMNTEEESIIYKPNKQVLLKGLLYKYFPIQLWKCLLESQAAEQGARMSAMENATQNANEMLQKLTLQYNKQRQAGITKELLEIIAGCETQLKS